MIGPGTLAPRGLVSRPPIPCSLYDMSYLLLARSMRWPVWRTTFLVSGYAYSPAVIDRPANADPFATLGACTSQSRQILTFSLSSVAVPVIDRGTYPGTETETSP